MGVRIVYPSSCLEEVTGTAEAIPPYDLHNSAPLLLILMRAQGLYADLFDARERADPEDDKYRRLLEHFAYDLDGFIAGMERLQEGGA